MNLFFKNRNAGYSELTAGGAAGVLQDDALACNNVHCTLKIIYFY